MFFQILIDIHWHQKEAYLYYEFEAILYLSATYGYDLGTLMNLKSVNLSIYLSSDT